MAAWQAAWMEETRGRLTAALLPDVKSWVGRGFGEVDYYLTQLLSGHGYFREFLRKMGKRSEGNCVGMRDDAHHTFFVCERWGRARRDLERRVGEWVPERFQSITLSGRAQWNAVWANSNEKQVTLKDLDFDASEGQLEDPHISFGKPTYMVGEWLQVNCTSGPARPTPDVTWLINGRQAQNINNASHSARLSMHMIA
uniref:Uncharacterized protein n=1 Tax=Rhodnius prolixus TaxID=13249 RepID=T1HT18_RHOPR